MKIKYRLGFISGMWSANKVAALNALATKIGSEYNFQSYYFVNLTKLTNALSNQTLKVYGIVCSTKTINTKNSIYTDESKFMKAPDLHSIVLSQLNMNPLKFAIAH